MHSRVELEAEIVDLLKKFIGDQKPPTPNQRLFHDLGLYGDDAWEFFDELGKRIGISEPQFDGAEYFPSEGEWLSLPLPFINEPAENWKPMTIADLAAILHQASNSRVLHSPT